MSTTISFFSQPRPLAMSRLAFLLTLGTLAGCARAPIRLDVSPARGPALGATIGPLTLTGALGAGGMDVRASSATGAAGRRRWSPPSAVASASAARVLATADRYVGTRYRYGGESPAEGFDCSGFVQFVFGLHGVELPRTSRQQASAGRVGPREIARLQPGDLMFFASNGRRIDHVAIYAGDGRIIHASSGSGRVRYDDIGTGRGEWYLRRLVTSRRVLSGV
jgi:cell wall-associated NlpC family hydrolase